MCFVYFESLIIEIDITIFFRMKVVWMDICLFGNGVDKREEGSDSLCNPNIRMCTFSAVA